MKIDLNPALPLSPLLTHKPPQRSFIDYVLADRAPHDGDDYGAQYGEAMQHSALTFKHPSHALKTIQNHDDEPLAHKAKAIQVKTIESEKNHVMHTPSDTVFKSASSAPVPTHTMGHQDIKRHNDGQCISTPSASSIISAKKARTAEDRALRPVPDAAPLADHHLYIDAQGVQLSLHCADLTPVAQRELTTLIKQWLSRQNLTIHQFMINGVPQ